MTGRLSEQQFSQAAEAIRGGAVIAVPTETYYGLAADPENESALAALFTLKQRPLHKPILLLLSRFEQIWQYVSEIPRQYETLISHYWPGPLTLVFPALPHVSPLLTGGTGTIGIRLTPHPVACRIIELLGRPITATSANLAGHEPARTAREVNAFFGQQLAMIIDGGPADRGPGSTVLNICKGILCVEREGRVALPGLQHCPSSGAQLREEGEAGRQ